MPKALILLAPEFEEIEAVAPIDLLRRAGVDCILAAVGEEHSLTGKTGITVRADRSLSSVFEETFDLIFLPGGPGVKHLRGDACVLQLVKRQFAAGRWLAAICAAPTVLHQAGLLSGRKYTCHFSVADELTESLRDQRIVEDGNLLTSQGAGTAVEFGLFLVEKLVSLAKAEEIRRSICA